MPSGSTANPQREPIDLPKRRIISRRTFGVLLLSGGVLSGLSACAEGTARDADRGKQADLKRTSVVDDWQATESARLIQGTPEGTPTTTP